MFLPVKLLTDFHWLAGWHNSLTLLSSLNLNSWSVSRLTKNLRDWLCCSCDTPQSAGHIVMLGIWNVKTCWLSGTSFYWQQSKVMIQLLRTQPTVKQEEQTNTRTRGFLPHHKNHWMGGIWDWDWAYSWPSLAQQIADILQVFLCCRGGEEVVV